MRVKKILEKMVLIITAMIIAILISSKVYAVNNLSQEEQRYFGIEILRESGYGFKIPSQTNTNVQKIVWKILEYNNNNNIFNINGTNYERTNIPINYDTPLYCLRAEYGFQQEQNTIFPIETVIYNQEYDMVTEQTGIMKLLDLGRQDESKEAEYNKIMWILDNMYTAERNNKEELIKLASGNNAEIYLSDDEVEVIQQLALWYYTNRDNVDYYRNTIATLFANSNKVTDFNTISSNINDTFKSLSDIFDERPISGEAILTGTNKQNQAQELYTYLIENADANYTGIQNGEISITKNATSTISGENYIVGPYKYSVTGNIEISGIDVYNVDDRGVETSIKNTVKILDANKNVYTAAENLLIDQNFYLQIPISMNLENIKIKITGNKNQTQKTLLVGNDETKTYQPVVEIKDSQVEVKAENTTKIIKPEFDLSLRKYIVSIANEDGVEKTINSREPNINKSTIETNKTAEYNHPKDAQEVDSGDIITYAITIYNEGQVDGRATKIVDRLPLGLSFLEVVSGNYELEDYDEQTNVVTLKETTQNNDLEAYNGVDIKSTTVKIKCKVDAKKEMDDQILTNIAWIDADTNKYGLTDRDSNPDENPNKTESELPAYIGKDTNKIDLTDSTYYYKGEQDDDDFEKVIIKGALSGKYNIEILKQDEDGNIITKETEFTVNDKKYTTVAGKIQLSNIEINKNNIGTTNYKITESKAPAGYNGISKEISLNVTTEFVNGEYVLKNASLEQEIENVTLTNTNTTITIIVKNTEKIGKYNLEIVKQDELGNLIEKDVEFTVNDVSYPGIDGYVRMQDIEINKNNIGTTNYKIIETKAPAGYNGLEEEIDLVVTTDLINGEYVLTGATLEKEIEGITISQNNKTITIIVKNKSKIFDLSLRKYIVKVDETVINRTPDTSVFANYTHRKDAQEVQNGSLVTYALTIYNEGEIAGRATKISDRLPEGLSFVSVVSGNYEVESYDTETNIVTLKETSENENLDEYKDGNLSYATVQIQCRVNMNSGTRDKILTNIAWISEDYNEYGLKDVDSNPEINPNPTENELPDYKGNQNNKNDLSDENYYYQGQEDDDDFEKVVIKGEGIDLNLQKYVSKVERNGETLAEPKTENEREYKVIANERHLSEKQANPVTVITDDIVIYTIKVCNQGKVSGYAKEIKDYIPTGLEFIEDNEINKKYEWVISSDGRTAITNYLSKDKSEDNILESYDGKKDEDGNPIYDENYVQIALKVNNLANGTMTNIAEINKHTDKDGNEDITDVDSVPGNKDEKPEEDDTDGDAVKTVTFDLSLRKYIVKIENKDGEEKTINSRIPEIKINNGSIEYLHRKDAEEVENGDIVTYKITIYNEGEVSGYATKIVDKLPVGIKYIKGQTIEGYIATYDESTNTVTFERNKKDLLQAFDGKEVDSETIYFKCQIDSESTTSSKVLTNIAWIAEDYNEFGLKDIDSNPSTNPNPSDSELPNYKGKDTNKEDLTDESYYYQGQEDDDDFEKVILPAKKFDLSLKKFVTEVINNDSVKQLDAREKMAQEYKIQNAVFVQKGNIIIYCIRVYNEGQISGYAEEITDTIPSGLKFLVDNEINQNNLWELSEDQKTIKTKKLSKENEVTDGENLIKAYDGISYDYKEVEVAFEVTEENTFDGKIINIAEITKDADKDGKEIDDIDSIPGNRDENPNEDDTDKEAIELQYFDLSLKKYIEKVNDDLSVKRELKAEVNEETGKIEYTLSKTPINVRVQDTITYCIRVYNEGEISGYAEEITDRLPEELEYIVDSQVNKKYGWKVSEDGKTVTTDYLSKAKETSENSNLINAFDKDNKIISYKEVEIECKVKDLSEDKELTNIAEITKDADKDGKDVDDIDSVPDNKKDGEDDQDKEIVKVQYFDLSLKKFIVKVNNTNINNRNPEVKYENSKITYKQEETPVDVETGDLVTYVIRIYNEGTISGYAEEVVDRLPEGLEFVENNDINKAYEWKVSEDGKEIRTDYLSKAKETDSRNNLLNAFEKNSQIGANNPAYKDLAVVCRVSKNVIGNTNLINIAEITKDADKDGKEVDDIDSIPDNKKSEEDDTDNETVRVKYFDLSLKKYVSKAIVIENGSETVTLTGHTGNENPEPIVKVDLDRKKISKTRVKFEYVIKVTNEGEVAGYAKEIKDYIPNGLKFVVSDNAEWKQNADGSIVTTKLASKLLNPGESAEVTVVLEWIQDGENTGVMTNIAEISKDADKDGDDITDIDSVPDNKNGEEDDIDDADVALTIKTGQMRIYYSLIASVLVVVIAGVALIKKYVI